MNKWPSINGLLLACSNSYIFVSVRITETLSLAVKNLEDTHDLQEVLNNIILSWNMWSERNLIEWDDYILDYVS